MAIGILIALTALASFAAGAYAYHKASQAGARTVWRIRGGEGDPTQLAEPGPPIDTETS